MNLAVCTEVVEGALPPVLTGVFFVFVFFFCCSKMRLLLHHIILFIEATSIELHQQTKFSDGFNINYKKKTVEVKKPSGERWTKQVIAKSKTFFVNYLINFR